MKNTIIERKRLRRQQLKQQLVDTFGNQCTRCHGKFPPECFDFHHTDPRMKKFEVQQEFIARYKWDVVLDEASKCMMLCANCHRTVHANHEEGFFEDAYRRHRDERLAP